MNKASKNMPNTNFKNEMLPKLNHLLKFVIENEFSDFYRNKYKLNSSLSLRSLDDFKKLPSLTKGDFLDVSLNKRIFMPNEKVTRFSFSSGTSGMNKIAVLPQASNGEINDGEGLEHLEYSEQLLKEGIARKLLLLWPVSSSAYHRNITRGRENAVIIPADINNLVATSLVAKKIGVDGIISTVTILEHLILEFEKINFDLNEIKWVSLGGEFCSSQKLKYLKSKLPSAFFGFRFGSSELQGRGYRCKHISDMNPNVFHPNPNSLIEIDEADFDSSYGEIIHTNLKPRPFPFIRYKTGDMAYLEEKSCPCGNNLLLTVGGRGALDVLRFSGITLHIQAIENSLDELREYFKPDFQMHVWEETINNRIKPKLELYLELNNKHQEALSNPMFKEICIAKISQSLQLSSKNTLASLVEQEVFLPLEIKLTDLSKSTHHKTKHIISHLNE